MSESNPATAMNTTSSSELSTSTPVRLEGLPKSGRFWKKKQICRASTQNRQGVLSHLSKTLDEKMAKKQREKAARDLEKEMKEEKKRKKEEERQRREEQEKRRLANEFKTTTFQVIKADKIKGMSKKQLRMVKKTSMNKNGQLELVNPWAK
eukprot:gene11427-12776_t